MSLGRKCRNTGCWLLGRSFEPGWQPSVKVVCSCSSCLASVRHARLTMSTPSPPPSGVSVEWGLKSDLPSRELCGHHWCPNLASIGVKMELFFVPAGVWKSDCFQPVATSGAFVLPAGPNLEPRSQFGAPRPPKLLPKL